VLERIKDIVNSDPWLQRKGRWVNAVFMVEAGERRWRLTVRAGRIESIETGPFVMPASDLTFRAPLEAWTEFWRPSPRPGCNDVFALLRRKVLRIEGNLQPFMANLFYFKGVLEAPRKVTR
jgi:hypothetical protein